MRNILNMKFNIDTYELVLTTLKDSEIAKLSRALFAHQRQDDPHRFLTSSGLRLAYALLVRDLDAMAQRQATLRANGARGGRPRKHPAAKSVNPVSSVKSVPPAPQNQTKPNEKKEDLPPTPPIEEKKEENNNFSLSTRERSHDQEKRDETTATLPRMPELPELQQQMLHEQPWLEQLCMSRGISARDMAMYVTDFIRYLRERDARETLQQAKVHFVNQLPYIINIYKNRLNDEKQHSIKHQEFIADPVARREFERESRRQAACRAIARLAAAGQRPAVIPF